MRAISNGLDGDPPGPAPERAPGDTITGRAILSNGEEFGCFARNVTVRSADILAKAKVAPGQTVVCHLDGIGLLPGKISAVTRQGFSVTFILAGGRLARIAAQLEWQAGQASRQADLRRCPRIVPLHRAVEVRLGERLVRAGTILNISMSGAAIALEEAATPFVGARVRIGSRFATVVRLIDGGVAVEFATPFTPDNFDECVRL